MTVVSISLPDHVTKRGGGRAHASSGLPVVSSERASAGHRPATPLLRHSLLVAAFRDRRCAEAYDQPWRRRALAEVGGHRSRDGGVAQVPIGAQAAVWVRAPTTTSTPPTSASTASRAAMTRRLAGHKTLRLPHEQRPRCGNGGLAVCSGATVLGSGRRPLRRRTVGVSAPDLVAAQGDLARSALAARARDVIFSPTVDSLFPGRVAGFSADLHEGPPSRCHIHFP
jgi:hypothetical protein